MPPGAHSMSPRHKTLVARQPGIRDIAQMYAPALCKLAGQQGTTLLQIQIGLSRLVMGAGYRAMKGAYALDHFTHEKDSTLPYTFEALMDFTDKVRPHACCTCVQCARVCGTADGTVCIRQPRSRAGVCLLQEAVHFQRSRHDHRCSLLRLSRVGASHGVPAALG